MYLISLSVKENNPFCLKLFKNIDKLYIKTNCYVNYLILTLISQFFLYLFQKIRKKIDSFSIFIPNLREISFFLMFLFWNLINFNFWHNDFLLSFLVLFIICMDYGNSSKGCVKL